MAKFNPNEYETVADRLKRFHADHPHARIVTRNETTEQDRQVSTWIVRAEIYLPMFEIWEDAPAQENPENSWYLKATGYAFEIDGTGMANQTSALENAETSAIGRALANMGYHGDKRPSATEMAKANTGVVPPATSNRKWLAEAEVLKTSEEVRKLWAEARAARVSEAVLASIQKIGEKLANTEAGKQ